MKWEAEYKSERKPNSTQDEFVWHLNSSKCAWSVHCVLLYSIVFQLSSEIFVVFSDFNDRHLISENYENSGPVSFMMFKADSHVACCAAKGLECVFPIWFTLCSHAWFTLAMACHAHAAPMPCSDHAVLLKAMTQHGRQETACGLLAHVQLLPATMRSSTMIVIRSIPILLTTIHTYDCKEW